VYCLTKAVRVIVFPSGGKEKECEAVDALIQISGMLIDATQIFLNVGYGDNSLRFFLQYPKNATAPKEILRA